jgi:hypothetical protein
MNDLRAFFIIILFLPLLSFSQESLTLKYGDNHESEISDLGEVDNYDFEASAGDVIMIRMRDETKVDSYIKLYDPDGLMVESSWSDGGLAKIKDFQLEKTGTYEIKAYDRNHNDVGKYGISLHKLNGQDYAERIPAITSFEDHIDEIVGVNFYDFEAEEGDVLYTIMRALTVHLECEFFIYDSSGEQVFRSINKGRSATVGPVALEKTDTYSIVVTDRGGNDKDKFGLTHMLLNKHESIPNLQCGDNASSTLDKLAGRKFYRLITAPGQIPLVEARSNNTVLETSFEIYDEKGQLVSQKSQTNKLLSEVIPASDEEKSYLITVFDRNGNDFGDFGLQVQFLDDSYCPDELSCVHSKDSISIDGLAQNRLFSIQGIAGEPVNVILKEKQALLEPHVRMYNLSGDLIFEKYDGVKVDLSDNVFPYTGKFLLLASDRSGNDIGKFEISAPASDIDLDITGCQTVFRGFEPMASATVFVEGKGDNLTYEWSNGATTQSIHVTPLESTNYSVTVSNSSGCSGVTQTLVEVIDTRCGNGNGSEKVEVCHVKNNGQHQTLCISINGVWGHLENGEGHKDCHIGPCDYDSACSDDNDDHDNNDEDEDEDEDQSNMEVSNRSGEIDALIFPNPTSNDLSVNLNTLSSDMVRISIVKFSGEVIYNQVVKNEGGLFTYSFGQNDMPEGLYLIKIDSDDISKTQSIIYLK